MIYLLDANSFIQAKNLHYRMHVVPGFWQWLTSIHPHHRIASIDPIYKELTNRATTYKLNLMSNQLYYGVTIRNGVPELHRQDTDTALGACELNLHRAHN